MIEIIVLVRKSLQTIGQRLQDICPVYLYICFCYIFYETPLASLSMNYFAKTTHKLARLGQHAFHTFGWRNLALVVFAVDMLAESTVEVFEEFAQQEPLFNMVDDIFLLFLGVVAVVVVCIDAWYTRNELASLKAQLTVPTDGVAGDDPATQEAAHDYSQAVEKQFATWKLTLSEREVAVALLKGLSFQEIALMRDTREKTVRQHASTVYRKSGLAGRHELAAWFFEDLLGQGAASLGSGKNSG